jgi:hypothetical protein
MLSSLPSKMLFILMGSLQACTTVPLPCCGPWDDVSQMWVRAVYTRKP